MPGPTCGARAGDARRPAPAFHLGAYRKPGVRLAEPRADAGVGAALTIKRFGPLVDIKPLTIRFDMPLFLSATPATDTDNLAFRYVVAVGRSF